MLIPPGQRHLTPGSGASSADLETTYVFAILATLRFLVPASNDVFVFLDGHDNLRRANAATRRRRSTTLLAFDRR
jgi:hypothetical protein